MKKVQIDPATQQRPTSRKQNRSAKIKEQLTQQVEVQVIPAKTDVEGYERPKPRVGAYCRVSTDMNVPGTMRSNLHGPSLRCTKSCAFLLDGENLC